MKLVTDAGVTHAPLTRPFVFDTRAVVTTAFDGADVTVRVNFVDTVPAVTVIVTAPALIPAWIFEFPSPTELVKAEGFIRVAPVPPTLQTKDELVIGFPIESVTFTTNGAEKA